MSEFDVSPFEMDNNPLSDTDIEALLAGDQTTGPDELHDLMGGLRERFETSTDVPVGAALAEFIDVLDLTTTSSHAEPQRKRKMITGIGTLIATTTGKIVLGTTLAAASVGGAHAVDLVDVPGLPESSAEVIVVDETEGSEETFEEVVPTEDHHESQATEKREESADTEEELVENSDEEDEADDQGGEEDGEDGENHGQVVSDFAHSTELEGCEKGQAIAALASSKANGKHKNDDDGEESRDSDDVDDVDEDESEGGPCKDHDEDENDEDENDDSDHDESDDDEHPGNGKAKNKKADHDDDDDDDDGDDDDDD